MASIVIAGVNSAALSLPARRSAMARAPGAKFAFVASAAPTRPSARVAGPATRGATAVAMPGAARGDMIMARAAALDISAPAANDDKKQLLFKIAVGVGVAALALAFPCASLAAAKAKGAAAAAYPISFLPYTHNQILHAVNLGSLPAWFSLLVLPRWHMTKKITAAVAVAYSVLYVALAYALFSESILSMDYSSLSTTQGLSKAFSEATSVLAGWAHFIVFDLWTARYFVLDSGRSGIPHLAVVPAILGCMFFGPLGLLTYLAVKKVSESRFLQSATSTKTFNF